MLSLLFVLLSIIFYFVLFEKQGGLVLKLSGFLHNELFVKIEQLPLLDESDELGGPSGVFAGQNVHSLERVVNAETHISEISDGRGTDGEGAFLGDEAEFEAEWAESCDPSH